MVLRLPPDLLVFLDSPSGRFYMNPLIRRSFWSTPVHEMWEWKKKKKLKKKKIKKKKIKKTSSAAAFSAAIHLKASCS